MIMERGAFTGRDHERSTLATILLLMCMFIPTLTSEQQTCLDVEYLSEKGICCDRCFKGYKLAEECTAPGRRSKCIPCPSDQYRDTINFDKNCRKCKSCKRFEVMVSPCKRTQNTVCRCQDGYYKLNFSSQDYACYRCKTCELNEKEIQKCTPENDTVCACEDNYYRNTNNKCEICSNCTAECESQCGGHSMSTTAKEHGTGCTHNAVIGVAAAALVLLLLVAFVTHVVTKRCTEKKWQKSSQSPNVSPDPSEESLIPDAESSLEFNVKVATINVVTECGQPNKLPDCIPPEIKISDLIYNVLDLVPVSQVKQLVRFLGVSDTEIEQVQLDYRSCREAHYQMLRTWAERGPRSGVLLHPPLLLQLLNELRKMNLEQAAQELETNYGFT